MKTRIAFLFIVALISTAIFSVSVTLIFGHHLQWLQPILCFMFGTIIGIVSVHYLLRWSSQ